MHLDNTLNFFFIRLSAKEYNKVKEIDLSPLLYSLKSPWRDKFFPY